MTSPYRALFAAPGSKSFSAAGLLGRMPLSMMGIGVVTMISQLTGRYGLAGALSATIALAAAAMGPQVSRLVDLHGQRRVLRPVTVFALAAAGMLLVAAHYGWPDWVLFVCSAGIGCVPSIGAMIRARWAALYGGTPQLHTAYSLESVVDEICFIFGPIISIGLSTVWFPEAGPLLAACFLTAGVFWLTSQHATEPQPHPRGQHSGGSALRSAGLQVLVATFVATGRSSEPSTWSPWPSPRSRVTRAPRASSWPSTRRAPASRERSSDCCTSRGRRKAGGCWAYARWP